MNASPGSSGTNRGYSALRLIGTGGDAMDRRLEHGARGRWLAPVALDSPRKKVREKQSSRRASHEGCLPLTLDQDLKLRKRFRTEAGPAASMQSAGSAR